LSREIKAMKRCFARKTPLASIDMARIWQIALILFALSSWIDFPGACSRNDWAAYLDNTQSSDGYQDSPERETSPLCSLFRGITMARKDSADPLSWHGGL
jgi:hypothetical protein